MSAMLLLCRFLGHRWALDINAPASRQFPVVRRCIRRGCAFRRYEGKDEAFETASESVCAP